jgi:hypothetical protein
MTHDVLQCDIDLARGLLEAGHPGSEAVAALTYRGVDSGRATQLVANIQSGKTVEPDKPIAISVPRKIREEIIATADGRSPQRSRIDSPSGRNRSRSRNPKRDGFPWPMLIALASAVLCVGAFVVINRKSHTEPPVGSRVQSASNSISDSGGGLSAKEISLEIQQSGLRLCNSLVNREAFLSAIFKILGEPSRTNHVENLEHVIYAYDAYGLLIYSPKKSGNYSVVLDFEAIGGSAGTRNPFVGTFKINDCVVRAATDAASLALIRELALEPPKSASGVFRAQFGGLELVFGYFNSPERLSLAEIDFK